MTHENMTEENPITQRLAQIEVKPTRRFYQQMANKPWMRVTPVLASPNRGGSWRPGMQTALAGITVMLIVYGLIFQMPALRLLAQAILSRFVQQPTDTIAKTELLPGSGEYINWYEDQKQAIKKAKQAAGFDIAVPAVLPVGYRFGQVIYISEERLVTSIYISSTLPYTDALASNSPEVSLLQQPLAQADKTPLSFKIGASANVEAVSINGLQGEFVRGAWTSMSSEDPTLNWTPEACCRMLRWQTDEYVFTLFAWNYADRPGFTDRDELIKVATSVTFAKE